MVSGLAIFPRYWIKIIGHERLFLSVPFEGYLFFNLLIKEIQAFRLFEWISGIISLRTALKSPFIQRSVFFILFISASSISICTILACLQNLVILPVALSSKRTPKARR